VSSRPPAEQRLGVFVENAYLITDVDGAERVHSHSIVHAFSLFACEVGRNFRTLTFFGRSRRDGPDEDYHPLPQHAGLIELPFYSDLTRLGELARAVWGSTRAIWRGLAQVDVVWVLGPHPFSFLVLVLALLRGRRVVLGVRQDTVRYYRNRIRSRPWRVALPAVWAMDWTFRILSRRLPTAVVGSELASRYGREGSPPFVFTVSLMRAADIASVGRGLEGGALERAHLLTVARVEPEKNPVLLIEALARLELRHPGRFELTLAGDGRLLEVVRARAEAEGLRDRVHLLGFVPFGPRLLDLYGSADIFVHVALTEGLPQALVEALASGVPVVGTDVGSVAEAVDHGNAGLLVPPRDVDALVRAILSLADDGARRRHLVARGLEVARHATLELQAARVARFIASG
jgi:glycosyltransferase involved in cell wall biosynthesis